MADSFATGFATGQRAYESWRARQDKEKDRESEKREREARAGYYDAQAEQIRRGGKEYDERTSMGAGMLSAKMAILRQEGESDEDLRARRKEYRRENPLAGSRIKEAKATAMEKKQDAIKKKLENKFTRRANKSITDDMLSRRAEAETGLAEQTTEGLQLDNKRKQFQLGQDRAFSTLERTQKYLAATQKYRHAESAEKRVQEKHKAEKAYGEQEKAATTLVTSILDKIKHGDVADGGLEEQISEGYKAILNLPAATPEQEQSRNTLKAFYDKEIADIKKGKDWLDEQKSKVREAVINKSVRSFGDSEDKIMAELKKIDPERYDERRAMHYMYADAQNSGIPVSVFTNPEFQGRIFANMDSALNPHYLNKFGEPATDKEGNIIKNKVLNTHATLRQWDGFKEWWKAKYATPVTSQQTRTEGGSERPPIAAGSLDLDGTGAGGSGAPQVSSERRSTEVHLGTQAQINPLLASVTPPQDQWDAVDTNMVDKIFAILDDPNLDNVTTPDVFRTKEDQQAYMMEQGERTDRVTEEVTQSEGLPDTSSPAPAKPVPAEPTTPAPDKPKPEQHTIPAEEAKSVSKKHRTEEADFNKRISSEVERVSKDGGYLPPVASIDHALFGKWELSKPDINYGRLLRYIETDEKYKGKDPKDWPDTILLPITKAGWLEEDSSLLVRVGFERYREKVKLTHEERVMLHKGLKDLKKSFWIEIK